MPSIETSLPTQDSSKAMSSGVRMPWRMRFKKSTKRALSWRKH